MNSSLWESSEALDGERVHEEGVLDQDLMEITDFETTSYSSPRPSWANQENEAERTRLCTSHTKSLVRKSQKSSKGLRKSIQISLLVVAYRAGILSKYRGLRRLNRMTRTMSLTTLDSVIGRVNEYSSDYEKFRRLWIQHGAYLDRSSRALRRIRSRPPRLIGVGYRDKGSPPRLSRYAQEAEAEYWQILEDIPDRHLISIKNYLQVTLNPTQIPLFFNQQEILRVFRWRMKVFESSLALS
jgi:hypothetical protein